MRKWIILIAGVILVLTAVIVIVTPQRILFELTGDTSSKTNNPVLNLQAEVVVKDLNTPWSLAFLPNGAIFITERPGNVRFVNSDGELQSEPIARLPQVEEIGEGGLLGICLHPKFSTNNYVYLYYTYATENNNTLNRVSRFTYDDNSLIDEQVLIDAIPGESNHNGGRMAFGPDKYLYITTGDAANPSLAQNRDSLAGKILRSTDSGKPADGNPFDSLVYSYGHRNPQGIAWDNNGQLWSVEHGQDATDELNRIIAGRDYGWPTIRGNLSQLGLESPIVHSDSATWAPSGLAFWQNRLFFAGLRGQALYEFSISNSHLSRHLSGQYGRLRAALVGPDDNLYVLTSNRDGRGVPASDDDKLLRITLQ